MSSSFYKSDQEKGESTGEREIDGKRRAPQTAHLGVSLDRRGRLNLKHGYVSSCCGSHRGTKPELLTYLNVYDEKPPEIWYCKSKHAKIRAQE